MTATGRELKCLLLFVLSFWAFTAPAQPRQILNRTLEPGQAVIWYLYHSGWAVKTKNHLLVFDYTESPIPPPGRSLEYGSILLSEISDQNVTVFVSHGHSDHYDPRILNWRAVVKKIRYVWGWEGMDRRDKLPHPQRGLWIRPASPAVRALPRVLIRSHM